MDKDQSLLIAVMVSLVSTASYVEAAELEVDELTVNEKTTLRGDLVVTHSMGFLPSNSVLCFAFDTDEGGIVSDSVGDHTGTVNGATWEADGKIQGAYSFDGSNDYISVGNHADLVITGDMSIAMWIKQDSSARRGLITMDGSSETQADNILYRLLTTATGGMEYIHEYGTGVNVQDLNMQFGISTGTWTHVVMVRDTSLKRVTLYKDANADPDVFNYPANPDGGGSSDLVIGAAADGQIPFNGLLDEVIIYDRMLTPTEITNIYLYNGTNNPSGTVEFREGIEYIAPLGDLEMGIYQKKP